MWCTLSRTADSSRRCRALLVLLLAAAPALGLRPRKVGRDHNAHIQPAHRDSDARALVCGNKSSASAEAAAAGHLRSALASACCWGGEVRYLGNERREALLLELAPTVEEPPPAPLRSSVPARPLQPNCKDANWFPSLLSGKPRRNPVPIVDVISGMGGGPELELLELRLHELQDVADLFVVSESAFNFRGDSKPRHFERQKSRFEAFLPRIVYLDLDACHEYREAVESFRGMDGTRRQQAVWGIQNTQRDCIWRLLQEKRPDIDNSSLVIFSDLDEIPSRAAMTAVKHCEPSEPDRGVTDASIMALHLLPIYFNLRSAWGCDGRANEEAWVQGVVLSMGEVRKRMQRGHGIQLRYKGARSLRRAGVHLTYFGSLGQVLYKGLQHGEGGGLALPEGADPCTLASSEKHVKALEGQLRDQPASVIVLGAQRSRPTGQSAPDQTVLERCLVPWPLLESPERYPHFWGSGH